jgi:hypothetical protein
MVSSYSVSGSDLMEGARGVNARDDRRRATESSVLHSAAADWTESSPVFDGCGAAAEPVRIGRSIGEMRVRRSLLDRRANTGRFKVELGVMGVRWFIPVNLTSRF